MGRSKERKNNGGIKKKMKEKWEDQRNERTMRGSEQCEDQRNEGTT